MAYQLNDRNGEPLRKGFYWDDALKQPVLFKGEYDDSNHAIIRSHAETLALDSNHVREHLCRFKDANKYTLDQLVIVGWMIDELSNLEEIDEVPPTNIFIGPQQGDHSPFGKHPWKRDGGYVHPDKRY
jgi:hypothetical protein